MGKLLKPTDGRLKANRANREIEIRAIKRKMLGPFGWFMHQVMKPGPIKSGKGRPLDLRKSPVFRSRWDEMEWHSIEQRENDYWSELELWPLSPEVCQDFLAQPSKSQRRQE